MTTWEIFLWFILFFGIFLFLLGLAIFLGIKFLKLNTSEDRFENMQEGPVFSRRGEESQESPVLEEQIKEKQEGPLFQNRNRINPPFSNYEIPLSAEEYKMDEKPKMEEAAKMDEAPKLDEVLLGASAPHSVKPKEEFTARFAAYIESLEGEIGEELKELSPRSSFYSGLKRCRWQPGTKIKVKCYGNHLKIEPEFDTFEWNGNSQILDFDVTVGSDVEDETTILKFDVLISEIVIARLRIDIEISPKASGEKINTAKFKPFSTAFASYASADRLRVLDRISEIQRNGIDVFLDCLSLHPGDEWKPKIEEEITRRELFLLFWSAKAKESKYVDWEWRTAYKFKGISGIDPHPLDPVFEAAPPEELAGLHFGDPVILVREAYEHQTEN